MQFFIAFFALKIDKYMKFNELYFCSVLLGFGFVIFYLSKNVAYEIFTTYAVFL